MSLREYTNVSNRAEAGLEMVLQTDINTQVWKDSNFLIFSLIDCLASRNMRQFLLQSVRVENTVPTDGAWSIFNQPQSHSHR